jgi:ATP-dependent RNA helicase RhlE
VETGNSVPRTDLSHPNPLDSDVVMDATARLLAPRHAAAVRETERTAKTRRKKRHTAPQPTQTVEPPKRTGQKKKGQSASKPQRDRQGGGRRGPQEPRRSHPKDSTEQPSLMKPYYLDIGR